MSHRLISEQPAMLPRPVHLIHLDHLILQAPTQPKVPDHLLKPGPGRALFGGHGPAALSPTAVSCAPAHGQQHRGLPGVARTLNE